MIERHKQMIDRQTDRRRPTQMKDAQKYRSNQIHTDTWTQKDRHMKDRHRNTDRQMKDRQTQKDRQTDERDTQKDRQMKDRHTERQTDGQILAEPQW